VGWRALSRPSATVSNRLVLPVRIQAEGVRDSVLPPGESRSVRVPRSGTLLLRWDAVRPMVGALPVGEMLSGSAALGRGARGSRLTIGASGAGFAWFAPLITNTTDAPLRIVVNAGLASAFDCGCEVPPGAVRMPIGYYRLYRNSTVEARDRSGRAARFENVAASVVTPGNSVGIRLNPGDLRPVGPPR
jgi:hypothetical protein